ncbi:uncharacterized protein LOC142888362 isoform X2 [Nelusetta ayraudi]|uniref:uncharacterized protein LOC142888362 isoform X2 n=1 Tax=Nelusetta ayraudi TaxID=303726 RepID=UPI003F70E56C
MFGTAGEESVNSIKTWTNVSNSSVNPQFFMCMNVGQSFAAYNAYMLGFLLLVPFFVLVLHVALQRWRSATTTANGHMDVLTYHMVLLELLSLVGTMVYYFGSLTGKIHEWGTMIAAISSIGNGKALFHLLACLDRYLAVVHPISLVMPLLLLQRAGKLPNCQHTSKSEREESS